jgi:hypothetical protein
MAPFQRTVGSTVRGRQWAQQDLDLWPKGAFRWARVAPLDLGDPDRRVSVAAESLALVAPGRATATAALHPRDHADTNAQQENGPNETAGKSLWRGHHHRLTHPPNGQRFEPTSPSRRCRTAALLLLLLLLLLPVHCVDGLGRSRQASSRSAPIATTAR